MTTIEIGGRKIPLLYTTCELIEIQKAIGCTGFQLKTEVFGVHLENEDDPDSVAMDVIRNPEKIEKLCKLIRIMGNAGLEENGEAADLTDKWVMRHIKPVMILPYAVMTLAELRDTKVDMFTTVFIGNSFTKVIDGKMVVPRGYRDE